MIVGDALSCLIHYYHEKMSLKGFHFENLSDDLTHLQYVDDTLLFLLGRMEIRGLGGR